MNYIIILLILFTVMPLVLGMIAEPMRVQALYYGFTQILPKITTKAREALRPQLEKSRICFLRTCVSCGIHGEHALQRFFGAILMTSVTALSVYVEYKIVSITLAAVFGIKLRDAGNISFDMLAGLSLIVSLLILFLILFDLAGKTHLTPIRERIDNSPKLKKTRICTWYGIVFSGIFFGAWIIISTAIVRYESHNANIARKTELMAQQVNPIDENLMILNDRNVEKRPKTETPKNQISMDMSKAQNTATKNVMIGIPLLALLTSGLAGIGVAYLGGFLFGFIQMIITYIFIGIPYMLFSLLYSVNETLIRAVLAVISFITDLGSAIRKRFGWAELVGPREPESSPPLQVNEHAPKEPPPIEEPSNNPNPIIIRKNFNPLEEE